MYCSTHRVPSATKRRSLPTSYRSYRYRHRYQYKSLPDYFFIGQRGVDGAAARAINMGRSRTRSRYIRRFFSKARGWLSVCSLLRTHLRSSLSVVSASSSRSLCFPPPPTPTTPPRWGENVLNACFTCIFCSLHVLRIVVVRMGGSIASLNRSPMPSVVRKAPYHHSSRSSTRSSTSISRRRQDGTLCILK